MSRIRFHVSRHALEESIPLRLGKVIDQPKLFLENITEDKDGTLSQRKSERDNGRRHIVADAWTLQQHGDFLGRLRLVVSSKQQDHQDELIITILPRDNYSIRTSQNLTEFLANERKKRTGLFHKDPNSPANSFLTPQYIAEVLHPKVINGEITNQTHLADHISEVKTKQLRELMEKEKNKQQRIREVAEEAIHHVTKLEQAVEKEKSLRKQAEENERSAHEKLAAAIRAQRELATSETPPQFFELPQNAKQVTLPWRSKTGSSWMNVALEATITKVSTKENRIVLTFIDENRRSKSITDFAYNGFVEPVYRYLRSRENRTAIFITTQQPDGPLRLASDTMMLDHYRDLWHL